MILFNAYNTPHLPIHVDTPPRYIDNSTASTFYSCWEEIATAQYIEKTIEIGGEYEIGYALGTWAGRAGLTYVGYHEFDWSA